MGLKAELDRLLDEVELDVDDPTPEQRTVLELAAGTFKRRGPEVLEEATPYLWEYYRWMLSLPGPEDREEWGIPDIGESEDIWEHVEIEFPPSLSLGDGPYEPGGAYLSFEGSVTWEPEHGLQLVFEDGSRLCKVGPYDGHVTQAAAYADLSLLGVIFPPHR